jgi:hypothetical protein
LLASWSSPRKNIELFIPYEINNINVPYYFVPQRKKYYGVVSNKLSREINIIPNKYMLTIPIVYFIRNK